MLSHSKYFTLLSSEFTDSKHLYQHILHAAITVGKTYRWIFLEATSKYESIFMFTNICYMSPFCKCYNTFCTASVQHCMVQNPMVHKCTSSRLYCEELYSSEIYCAELYSSGSGLYGAELNSSELNAAELYSPELYAAELNGS